MTFVHSISVQMAWSDEDSWMWRPRSSGLEGTCTMWWDDTHLVAPESARGWASFVLPRAPLLVGSRTRGREHHTWHMPPLFRGDLLCGDLLCDEISPTRKPENQKGLLVPPLTCEGKMWRPFQALLWSLLQDCGQRAEQIVGWLNGLVG